MGSADHSVIIVSNRLPITVRKNGDKIEYIESSGGLATGLQRVNDRMGEVWIGWPGISAEELTVKEREQVTKHLKKHKCLPVFLTQEQIDGYYSGYSNETLWPLLHYTHERSEYNEQDWEVYRRVNELFRDAIVENSTKDTFVWVHDYHLMLVPSLVRERLPKAKIGFFMHTPFPSFEIFRLVPERKELLCGLMGANLIGFHTYDYVRHFMSSTLRLLGYESVLNNILVDGRQVRAEVFPIGIDYEHFAKSSKRQSVRKKVNSVMRFDEDTKVILSIDRADYSKGIPHRLDSYAYFLEHNPQYHRKVTMLLVVAPSREDIEAYQKLQEEVDLRISQINGAYSTVDWAPISYINRDLPLDEVIATYAMSDVILVTPLRDGMNLMAKEFVATKQKGDGVLVLSEMAGAASELLEAIIVNPNDSKSVAQAIVQALEMPPREQKQRLKAMQERISQYSINKWANEFIEDLDEAVRNIDHETERITKALKKDIVARYKQASRRLIMLDYDGTLREFVSTPDADAASPSSFVLQTLTKLNRVRRNTVIVVSGRPRRVLARWFQKIPVDLVAEHGGWIRRLKQWTKGKSPLVQWKKTLEPILADYKDRTPGAIVERKDFALVWHYRKVTPELAYVRNEELKKDLEHALNGMSKDIGIFEGDKILEIKPHNMHKGHIAQTLIAEKDYDFILVIGDDYTDEDMFRSVPGSAITIKVGSGPTEARYRINTVHDAQQLIAELASS